MNHASEPLEALEIRAIKARQLARLRGYRAMDAQMRREGRQESRGKARRVFWRRVVTLLCGGLATAGLPVLTVLVWSFFLLCLMAGWGIVR